MQIVGSCTGSMGFFFFFFCLLRTTCSRLSSDLRNDVIASAVSTFGAPLAQYPVFRQAVITSALGPVTFLSFFFFLPHPHTPFSACDFVMEASCVRARACRPLFLACPPYHFGTCSDTTTTATISLLLLWVFSGPHLSATPSRNVLAKSFYASCDVRITSS